MNTSPHFRDNTARSRFEMEVDEQVAFIDYIINKQGIIFLTHTEVPKSLEGLGVASRMVRQALETIERNGLKLAPICPFVTSWLMRNPEWKRLLDENHRM